MFYKNWPYWLKGGIIAVLLFILVFIFSLFLQPHCPNKALGGCGLVIEPFMYTLIPGWIIVDFIDDRNVYVGFLTSFIVYFSFGALIGLIHKKFKEINRNHERNK
jgi:hypothetical protein